MIAQMLPGFRDVRTPLITGYLWLAGVWILYGMPVPSSTETDGLIGAMNALAKFLSPAVSVVFLSFMAYLLGILASPDSDRFLHPGLGFVGILERLGFYIARSPFRFFLSPRMRQRLSKEPGTFSPALTHFSEDALRAFVSAELAKLRSAKDFQPLHSKYNASDEHGLCAMEDLVQGLHKEVVEEALDPAAALLAKDEKLYNNFDRTRSEANFRFCITPPVLFVAIAASWRVGESNLLLAGALLLFGVFASAGLVFKGWIKLHESTDIAVAAVLAGTIKTRALGQLERLEPSKGTRRWWIRSEKPL